MADEIDSGPTIGSRHRFKFTITANSDTFTIFGGTINVYLRDPGGAVSAAHDVSSTISGETFYYDTDDSATPDLDEASDAWAIAADMLIGGRHYPTQWQEFEVFDGPPTP